jgi:mono/diheme cytochrome c family protein
MKFRQIDLWVAVAVLASCLLYASAASAQGGAADLYKAKCAGCHGPDGSASTPAGKSLKIRDFHSPDVQKQTDAELSDTISAGKGAMPAYKGKLTDDQIKQLVGYIRTFAQK